jgi:hypothetical protein
MLMLDYHVEKEDSPVHWRWIEHCFWLIHTSSDGKEKGGTER